MYDMFNMVSGANDSGSGFFDMTEDDNYTLASTCAARSIEAANGTLYSPTLSIVVRFGQVVYYIVHLILGLFLNSLAIFLIVKFKKLRTLSFCIAFQVLVINVCLTVFVAIALVVNNSIGRWAFNFQTCIFCGVILFIGSIVRVLIIFVLVFDRFLSVFMPLCYPKYNRKIVVALSVFSWIISVAYSLVILPRALDCYAFSEQVMLCTFSVGCNKQCSNFHHILLTTIVPLATIIPMGLFFAVYLKGKRIRCRQAQSHGQVESGISKQEWRATWTCFLLFISVFLVTAPSDIFIGVARVIFGRYVVFLNILVVISSILHSILVISDPIIIMRNSDVKESLKSLKGKLMEKCCPPAKNRMKVEQHNREKVWVVADHQKDVAIHHKEEVGTNGTGVPGSDCEMKVTAVGVKGTGHESEVESEAVVDREVDVAAL